MNAYTSCECIDKSIKLSHNNIVNTSLIKVCAFFGHRKIINKQSIQSQLILIIKDLIENKGYKRFLFGGLGEFDDLCYQIVSSYKQQYSDIVRVFYLFDKKHINERKRPKYISKELYEEIIYAQVDFDYWYYYIYYRNLTIVDNSDMIVFYVNHSEESGAYKIYKYAKKKNKNIILLS